MTKWEKLAKNKMTKSQWKAYGKLHGYWDTFEREVREKERKLWLRNVCISKQTNQIDD
jgi:hypothetical protein